MNTIKTTILYNWHFMRLVRLAFGVLAAYQAIKTHDAFSGLISVIFLFQAITNLGCCGSAGCLTNTNKNATIEPVDLSFEELKSNKN